MEAVIRRMAICYTLCGRRQIKMQELAKAYGVTTRTIRYDIEHLSLAHPIGAALDQEGKKVLLIDADLQAYMAISLGNQQPDMLPVTLSDLMGKALDG